MVKSWLAFGMIDVRMAGASVFMRCTALAGALDE